METNNSSKKDRNREDAMKKRRNDAASFLKKPRYIIKELSLEDIKEKGAGKLMFLTMIGRMGSSSYYFAVLENDNIEYYSTNGYNRHGFKTIIDSFKGLEDYSDENLMAAFRKEYYFKNFNFIDTGFSTGLFVNKEIFDEIKNFIAELCVVYGTDVDFFFWYDWIQVSKIYFSNNKDDFLLLATKKD